MKTNFQTKIHSCGNNQWINQCMDKWNVVYPYDAISLRHKKEWSTDAFYDMNESWFFCCCFLFFFGPLCGIWSSQAKDHIQVTVATYATTSAMLTLLTHCARPGNKPASSCTDATHPVVPQRELPTQMTLEDIIQSERRHGDCFMGASSPLGVMERFLN